MMRHFLAVIVFGLVIAFGAAACDKGPMQKTGEKIDRATGQDKVIGTDLLDQAGRSVNRAVKDLTK